MKAFVVDVNVAIVANGQSEQADDDCVLACIDALEAIHRDGMIVLDDSMQIMDEYVRYLQRSGRPGLGDSFMKWVWENQAVISRCEKVALTCRSNDPGDFELFPDDPDLSTFDSSDRKYVATALASRNNPELLNAVDTDWWHHRDALLRHRVRLRFVCPQHMRRRST